MLAIPGLVGVASASFPQQADADTVGPPRPRQRGLRGDPLLRPSVRPSVCPRERREESSQATRRCSIVHTLLMLHDWHCTCPKTCTSQAIEVRRSRARPTLPYLAGHATPTQTRRPRSGVASRRVVAGRGRTDGRGRGRLPLTSFSLRRKQSNSSTVKPNTIERGREGELGKARQRQGREGWQGHETSDGAACLLLADVQ